MASLMQYWTLYQICVKCMTKIKIRYVWYICQINVKIGPTDRGCLYFFNLPSLQQLLSQGFASLFVQQTPLKLKDTYCTAGTIAKTNHPESKWANEVQVVLPRGHKINQFGLLSDRQKNITYLKYLYLSNWVIETQAKLKWFGIDSENWQLCQNLKISKKSFSVLAP